MFKPMYAPPNYTTPARQRVIQAMQARRGMGAPQMPTYTNPYQFTGGVTAPASPEPMPMAAPPPMTLQMPPTAAPQAPSMPPMPNELPPQASQHAPSMGGMKSSPVEQPGAPVNQPAPAQTSSTFHMQRLSGAPINYGT